MYIVSFYDDLSMQSCQNESRSMMMWKFKKLKLWWKYYSYVFIRGCLMYNTCFPPTFRVNKHVPMYIVSFYDDLSIQSCQNESRYMMIWKIKVLKLWRKYYTFVFISDDLSMPSCQNESRSMVIYVFVYVSSLYLHT